MEILVHTGASSSKKHDDRFRAEATAYQRFEVGKKILLLSKEQAGNTQRDGSLYAAAEGKRPPGQPVDQGSHEQSQLPSDSAAEDGDEISSLLHGGLLDSHFSAQSVSQFTTSSSSKSVSQTAIVPRSFSQSFPTESEADRVQETFYGSLEAKSFVSQPVEGQLALAGLKSQERDSSTFIADTQRAAGALESQIDWSSPRSFIISTPHTSGRKKRRLTVEPASDRSDLVQMEHKELAENQPATQPELGADEASHTIMSGGHGSQTSQLPGDYSLSLSSLDADELGDVKDGPQPVETGGSEPSASAEKSSKLAAQSAPSSQASKEDVTPLPQEEIVKVTEPDTKSSSQASATIKHPPPNQPDAIDFTSLARRVDAPLPPTSTDKFVTHVTEILAEFAARPDMEPRLRLLQFARELRQTERGYWRVETANWPPDIQVDFWDFLGRMVRNGRLGWGVYCLRDPPKSSGNVEGSADEGAVEGSGLGVVKVFCWGEVVRHVYLVLYVGSRCLVKKGGCAWLDAEEKVTVRIGEK